MPVPEPQNQNKSPGYMRQLDEWTEGAVIAPLYQAWKDMQLAHDEPYIAEAQDNLLEVVTAVKYAVRDKVWESYRNGQAAQPREPRREYRRSVPAERMPARQGHRSFEPPF